MGALDAAVGAAVGADNGLAGRYSSMSLFSVGKEIEGLRFFCSLFSFN